MKRFDLSSLSPHQVTRDFEAAVADYCGAPYCVAVNSCTMALLLAVQWHLSSSQLGDVKIGHDGRGRLVWGEVEIPRRTYVSVGMSIIHAGGWPTFRDEDWSGSYQLRPYPIFDSARHLTSGMYRAGAFACLSFHASKTLGIEQGGAIIHDNQQADAWFRRMRFDGRTEGVAPKEDAFREIGWHCYMNPSTAAQGLLRLHSLARHNDPLPNDDYPDLSKLGIFK